jgi:hypothetical protein
MHSYVGCTINTLAFDHSEVPSEADTIAFHSLDEKE